MVLTCLIGCQNFWTISKSKCSILSNHDFKIKVKGNDALKYLNSAFRPLKIELDDKWKSNFFKHYKEPFKEFNKLRNNIYGIYDVHRSKSNTFKKETYGVDILEINSKKIAFVLLNSTWCTEGEGGNKDK